VGPDGQDLGDHDVIQAPTDLLHPLHHEAEAGEHLGQALDRRVEGGVVA